MTDRSISRKRKKERFSINTFSEKVVEEKLCQLLKKAMDVLESFALKQKHNEKFEELVHLKTSLKQQLKRAQQEQTELKESIDKLVQSGTRQESSPVSPEKELRESLAAYKWLGVSIKSFEDNLQIQFNPAYRGELLVEYYVLEIEPRKDSWKVTQHSLPPFIPVEQLIKESDGDIQMFVSSVSDYLFAYVQRREAISLVKKNFGSYLSQDIEADLPVMYVPIHLKLEAKSEERKIEITLHYCMTKTQPDTVDIEADFPRKQLESWRQWLLKLDINDGLANIIEDCG